MMTLNEVAMEIGRRICSVFVPGEGGRRPMERRAGQHEEPGGREYLVFPEYFNGDTGEGLGAMHQTGWTGLVAKMLDQVAVDRARKATPLPPTLAGVGK
jgi:hypothetical protein